MSTTKAYDYLNRLLEISSQPSAAGERALAHGYAHNDANQRAKVVHSDGTYWLYEYDELGQLIRGKRYWSDGTPVAGQQHEYGFDDIGNRISTRAGGDESGAGLRQATYTVNSLNQYSGRTVPGAVDVMGIAHAQAEVKVNGADAYRRGEYYRHELSMVNTGGLVWAAVTNTAVYQGSDHKGHI